MTSLRSHPLFSVLENTQCNVFAVQGVCYVMFYTWVFLINVGSHSVREQKQCINIHHTVRLTECFDTLLYISKIYENVCRKNSVNYTYTKSYILKIYDFVHRQNHIFSVSILKFKFIYLSCICFVFVLSYYCIWFITKGQLLHSLSNIVDE